MRCAVLYWRPFQSQIDVCYRGPLSLSLLKPLKHTCQVLQFLLNLIIVISTSAEF